MTITYREFTGSDADNELLLAIDNTASDFPKILDDLREEETWWKDEQLHIREFIYAGGELAGASLHYNMLDEWKTTHSGFYTLLPGFENRGLDRAVLRHLMDSAHDHHAENLNTNTKEANEDRLQVIRELGFEPTTSFVYSKLDLDRFDPQPFAPKRDAVRLQGIEVVSSQDLNKRGMNWYQEAHQLVGGKVDAAFKEQQRKSERSPTWFPESQFGALIEGRFVAMALMDRVRAAPYMARVSYTTVHPDFRRRGIATAVKVASIEAARRCGFRSALTCNESSIPMLQLNYQLGFKKDYENLCFKKVF